MPCGWEGNRRHGVALHGHASQTSVVSPPTAHDLKKGYEYSACTHLNGTANFIFIFCSGFVHYFRVRHFPVPHYSPCYRPIFCDCVSHFQVIHRNLCQFS